MTTTDGHHYLKLRCQGCGLNKQIYAWATDMKVGSVLPLAGWGQEATCLRCGAARLEILNSPETPKTEDVPQGFTRKP